MPRQQGSGTVTAYERAMRGLERLAGHDPGYWRDDRGPDVILLDMIVVGHHQWDVLAQCFRSAAGPDGDPYLAGLAALGIDPAEAAEFGFAGPDEGPLALVQGIHVFELRAGNESRPPRPSARKEARP